MEMNRHHYFLVGLVVLYVGLQFRLVDAFVLNEEATKFLAAQFGDSTEQASLGMIDAFMGEQVVAKKTVRPWNWVGWALISVGSVLVLHSLSMPRSGGYD